MTRAVTVSAVGAALAAAVVVAAAWHPWRTNPEHVGPIRVPGYSVTGARARPDGSVDVAMYPAAIGRIAADRTTGVPHRLPAADFAGNDGFDLAFLRGSGTAAVVWRDQSAHARGGATFLTYDAIGRPTAAPTRLQELNGSPNQMIVGPTGAIAISTDPQLVDRTPWTVAFRPEMPGATWQALRFIPPTPAKPDPYSDHQDQHYEVVLGPDGGGVALVLPGGAPTRAPYLQRFSAGGPLGPRIPVALGEHDAYDGSLAIGPGGTVVAAFGTEDQTDDEEVQSDAVATVALAPGASHASAPQVLVRRRRDAELDELQAPLFDLSMGGRDQALLVVNADRTPSTVYEGSGLHLRRTAVLPAAFDSSARGLVDADGGATIVSAGHPHGRSQTTLLAVHRPGGGAWSTPHRIVPATDPPAGYAPQRPIALPGGRAFVAYTRYIGRHGGQTFSARFTP